MIVAVSDRPELAPLVAAWRVAAFFDYPGGYTVERMTELILEPPVGPKETFVLFDQDEPVGTAALIRSDLETRPDLTPWLAGLWVQPAFRGRGHATALVRRVEAFATAASVPVLWLYTSTAEPLYARLGWERAGLEQDGGHEVVLMRRALAGERQVSYKRPLRMTAGMSVHLARAAHQPARDTDGPGQAPGPSASGSTASAGPLDREPP